MRNRDRSAARPVPSWNTPSPGAPTVRDFTPEPGDTLQEILRGLRADVPRFPSRLLYDARGSELFERITETADYYPTRTEIAIMRERVGEMADLLGSDTLLIEYGSGSGVKTRLLLNELDRPVGYVPIETSREALDASVELLSKTCPDLPVHPVCADYTSHYEVPRTERASHRRAAFFPGSTIGNFAPDEALEFLTHIAETCGAGGGLLIGVDLNKDTATLERAYDDSEGVTREFEFNVLDHVNRIADADFDKDRFRYEATYVESAMRIDMELVSRAAQTVRIGPESVRFDGGDRILCEHAHKFTLSSFADLAGRSGFRVERVWTDPAELFSVQYLTC